MAGIPARLHAFASSALSVCATPMLEKAWPLILKQVLEPSGFKEKSMASLLSGLRHALVIAPHPDDEFFGCPDLLLSLGDSGTKVTLAIILDGRGQASGRSISRVDMSSNAARLNGWRFAAMGWPDGFSCDASHSIREPLGEFLLPYLGGNLRADLIVLPIWCDYHSDHRAITVETLSIVSQLSDLLSYPDFVFYWTFSAPIRIPKYAQLVRVSSDRWTEHKQKWRLEYGTVVSVDAADRNRLIRAAVSDACWGEIGYETVLWVSGSHAKQACLEAQSECPSCVKLNGSRTIIPNTMIYGLRAALSRVLSRSV